MSGGPKGKGDHVYPNSTHPHARQPIPTQPKATYPIPSHPIPTLQPSLLVCGDVF